MTIYFTSDLHFCHPFVAALRGYCKTDDDPITLHDKVSNGELTFTELKDLVNWRKHDEDLINNFNEILKPEDELYVLGDLSTGGRASAQEAIIMVGRLKVPRKRRHLILGNHDPLIPSHGGGKELKDLLDQFNSVSRNEVIVIDGRNVALSHFQFRSHLDGSSNGRLSTNANAKEFSKYAVVDDGSLLLLHGHTHAKEPFEFGNPREMNVGVDAWSMKPVSEDVVVERLIKPNLYRRPTSTYPNGIVRL